ncbi:hypothetical protein PFICI_01167 [Pestalotiopsis fici W106-1]|uniref:Uncharacterized protein n=1 Tax=Pestalotiopsis fici (strain W106-1 / CGMCC3.15140) TaxID=1229662 RepID=W3XMX8_PESFW|nr:uncharacterized protein PFICI_01167 [Pestalotiopsis fici W106-1]ETS87339.1 hypothetical protein PFICI_01167 [Pestalotiopsis fici W106-1]
MATKEPSRTRSVLITGCSDGGIGAALAQCFASHPNLHVYASARSIAKMSELSTIPNITLLALDVTSPESIKIAVTTLQKATGGSLDILVNNAGCGYTMPYLDSDIEVAKALFEVNVWGPMRVTQAVQHMLVQARGTVVTVGSTAESLGLAYQSNVSLLILQFCEYVADQVGIIGVYCGSKAANRTMSETLRVELEPLGVKCLHVTTSFVKTSWFDNVPTFKLPNESYYQPIEKDIKSAAQDHGFQMMPAAEFNKQLLVVDWTNLIERA